MLNLRNLLRNKLLTLSFWLLGSLAVLIVGQRSLAAEPLRATAQLSGPGITGLATLSENLKDRFVEVRLEVKGDPNVLSSGLHGVHLHETGTCEAEATPAFSTAKGHHDPGPYGNTTPVEANHPFHLGDLPNLSIDAEGQGRLKAITSRVTLTLGPLSLFDSDGSAIILHKNPDLYQAGGTAAESGGARLACGVIQKA
jgi:superoxide dismutase, Cu-Zn family